MAAKCHGARKIFCQHFLESATPARRIFRHSVQREINRIPIEARVDTSPAEEPALRIGIVKIVQQPGYLDTLVVIQRFVEQPHGKQSRIHHQISPHHSMIVGKAIWKQIRF